MRNRTTCPNCGTEVDGSTLGYGTDEIDDGLQVFGCPVCVTPTPVAEEIAERAVKEGFSPGHQGQGKS